MKKIKLEEEKNKNMNNINSIKNELNKEDITSQYKKDSTNNKCNNLENQENEKNNTNAENNKLFLDLKDELKITNYTIIHYLSLDIQVMINIKEKEKKTKRFTSTKDLLIFQIS